MLQLLADTSGQNIVVSDSVQGNVTLRLQNVPWDQALDIVMRTKGLDKRQEGNVIFVAPAEELAAREKQLLESQKSLVELAPLRTEYLQVNYAKASDLAALIRAGGKGNSLLSERGSVAIDERTNTLLLQDTVGSPGGHPPPGADARHPGPAGADRGAHRDRQRRLQPRAGRALRRRRGRQQRQRRPDVRRLEGPRHDSGQRGSDHQPDEPRRHGHQRRPGHDALGQ